MMEEIRDTQRPSQALKKADPGLFESIGSFPVWLLRLIDLLTPDFLIKKVPPSKNKP